MCLLQEKLLDELRATALPLISKNKACVEKCITRLKSEIDELDARLLPESDPLFKVRHWPVVPKYSGSVTPTHWQRHVLLVG